MSARQHDMKVTVRLEQTCEPHERLPYPWEAEGYQYFAPGPIERRLVLSRKADDVALVLTPEQWELLKAWHP